MNQRRVSFFQSSHCVTPITYSARGWVDAFARSELPSGDAMDSKLILSMEDTYVMDQDVMDEMEEFDSTAVMHERPDLADDQSADDDGFLDDINASTGIY